MTTKSSKCGKTCTQTKTRPQNDAFDTLWRILPHPVGSVVRLFTKSGDLRDGDFATSAAEIRAFAKTYKDRNIYVAPNPTCSTLGTRHTAAEVTHWSYFLIDMDPICTCPPNRVEKKLPKCVTCRGNSEPRKALDEALLRIGEWMGYNFGMVKGVSPIIIDSGRGMQAWIRLEDWPLAEKSGPYGSNVLGRSVARRVNGYWLKKLDEHLGLCHGCRIDTSVSDLPRVMRVPGTVNVRANRTANFVHATDHVYKGLATLLLVGTPKTAVEDPDPPAGIAAGSTWQSVFPHLTRMAQNYLSLGQEEPGRHKVMWHTAKKLHELGVLKEETREALRWANLLRGKEAALPKDQIEHALKTAYGG